MTFAKHRAHDRWRNQQVSTVPAKPTQARHETVAVLVALMTSTIVEAPLYRLLLKPHAANGLKISSQIMIDKILALPRHKCGAVIGALDQSNLLALNTMLSVVIGLAD